MPVLIDWRPPASGNSIDLFVEYRGSTIADMKEASGAYAVFNSLDNNDAASFQAHVKIGGSEERYFNGAYSGGIIQKPAIVFSDASTEGQSVLTGIRHGERITVKVEKNGAPVTSETFDTSAIAARDELLTQAEELLKAADSKYCHSQS